MKKVVLSLVALMGLFMVSCGSSFSEDQEAKAKEINEKVTKSGKSIAGALSTDELKEAIELGIAYAEAYSDLDSENVDEIADFSKKNTEGASLWYRVNSISDEDLEEGQIKDINAADLKVRLFKKKAGSSVLDKVAEKLR